MAIVRVDANDKIFRALYFHFYSLMFLRNFLSACTFEDLDSAVEPFDPHAHAPDEFDEAVLHDRDIHDVGQLPPQLHSRLAIGIVGSL